MKNLKNKIFLFFILVFLDQFSKRYLLYKFGLGAAIAILPGFIRFFLVENTGGAFSILNAYPILFLIIGLINFLIFLYISFCPTIRISSLVNVACIFLLSGITGNLIDRIFRGAVLDFIDFEFVSFAIFNLADVYINIGIFLICIGWINEKKR